MTTTAKTIRTITRTPAAGRSNVVRLATAAVLATMAVTAAGGTAAAAPSAPLPTFTGYGNGHDTTDTTGSDNNGGGATAESPLLSPKQVAATLRTGALKETSSESELSDDSATVSPVSCIATYSPAQVKAYSATPSAVAQNILKDAASEVYVSQAVVTMAGKQDVAAQLKATVKQFKQCAGTTITVEHENSKPGTWTNGDPELNADKTVLSLVNTSARDGQCERAMAGYRNMVIDVMFCSLNGSAKGQGVALANAISERVSSQKA